MLRNNGIGKVKNERIYIFQGNFYLKKAKTPPSEKQLSDDTVLDSTEITSANVQNAVVPGHNIIANRSNGLALNSGYYTDIGVPYVIGRYKGIQPIDEIRGLVLGEKTYLLKLNCIISDAPAKAFILNVKNHTGYFGCCKCICEGDYYVERRVVFLSDNSAPGTNDSFRNRTQPEHHRGPTILETLDIDIIKQVPLDYMHLVLLGVTKRILTLWLKGGKNIRFSNPQIEKFEKLHLDCVKYLPNDFARKPRSLLDIERWKATEFRLFLLYTGPVVLKSVISATLERARKCAENPNYTTSSEVEKGKGRRKKKMYHRNYTSSSGSSSEVITPPPTPKSSAADYRDKNGEYDLPQNVYNVQDLYEAIESLKRICLKNQKMLEDLHLCMKSVQNEEMYNEKLNELKKKLPFQTLEDISKDEMDEGDKKAFAAFVKSVGGKDLRDNINRVLSKIFTNNLATSCSWYGKKGNYAVRTLPLMRIVVDSMVSIHRTTESAVERFCIEWFRLSRQRLGREGNKVPTT
nr:unnamed protein product [Callosobruchus analis]